jgi:hypothetical protein
VCPTNNPVCARGVFSGLYFDTLTLRRLASKHGSACTAEILLRTFSFIVGATLVVLPCGTSTCVHIACPSGDCPNCMLAGALPVEKMGGGELTNSMMLLYLRTDIKVRRLGVR